jgi:hypothetical protein
MRKFTINTQVVTENGVVESNCNAITFKNTGAATVYVKGVPLVTGEPMEVTGNDDEMDITQYDIRFGSGAAQLIVLRKTYQ